MRIETHSFDLQTHGFADVRDLTPRVQDLIRAQRLEEGSVLLFVPGSTAGLSTIEFESGAIQDLRAAVERLAPEELAYAHDARWGDGNGFSHVRAALIKPDLEVPVARGCLLLGTWQQIILLDFDNRARRRTYPLGDPILPRGGRLSAGDQAKGKCSAGWLRGRRRVLRRGRPVLRQQLVEPRVRPA
jgi:secondary thiamine-phosphate synthase enzyme